MFDQFTYIETIKGLHNVWTPHSGQIEIAKPLINEESRQVFAECGRNFGKAIQCDIDVATPNGFKKLGDIQSGDLVIGSDGKPCKVLIAHDILYNRVCYEIEFLNGERVIACEDHLWEVSQKLDRKRHPERMVVKRTKDLLNVRQGAEYNYQIRLTEPVQYAAKQLIIDPWLMGAWLGNGSTNSARFSTADKETLTRIESMGFSVTYLKKYDYYIREFVHLLRQSGVLQRKHIPEDYKNSSILHRLELLRGLMDTDGTIEKTGICVFSQSNKQMAKDVFEIVASLGERPTLTSRIPKLYGVPHQRSYKVSWTPIRFNPFNLKRKAQKVNFKNLRSRSHTIKSIKEVPSVPVRCLTVDAPDQLFLITKSFIPTHNTDLINYLLWRFANLRPNTTNYYFAPYQKQAREIIWASRRIQNFGPSSWIEGINAVEMRITFKNGAFIKLDGSDNIDSYRGVKIKGGGLVVYDEYKDFRPEFHTAMDPNLIDAYLLIVGTPPEKEGHFTETADEFIKNPLKRHFARPSESNPHINKTWLDQKRAELYLKGEGDVWEREYMARRVYGGKNAIFPMVASLELIPHRTLLNEIHKDRAKLDYYLIADPGTATCFGSLFIAHNPYNQMVYVLDEIYETNPQDTVTSRIGQVMIEKKNEAMNRDDRWTMHCDEAAQWFIHEIDDQFGLAFGATRKADNAKENGLSIMKDAFLANRVVISDKCPKFLWELKNYVKKNDKIPKANDHLIDCFRYFIGAANYKLQTRPEPDMIPVEETRRGYSIDEDAEEWGDEDEIKW